MKNAFLFTSIVTLLTLSLFTGSSRGNPNYKIHEPCAKALNRVKIFATAEFLEFQLHDVLLRDFRFLTKLEGDDAPELVENFASNFSRYIIDLNQVQFKALERLGVKLGGYLNLEANSILNELLMKEGSDEDVDGANISKLSTIIREMDEAVGSFERAIQSFDRNRRQFFPLHFTQFRDLIQAQDPIILDQLSSLDSFEQWGRLIHLLISEPLPHVPNAVTRFTQCWRETLNWKERILESKVHLHLELLAEIKSHLSEFEEISMFMKRKYLGLEAPPMFYFDFQGFDNEEAFEEEVDVNEHEF